MAHGYMGDGWGAHGDHGDDDFVREWYGDQGRRRDRGSRTSHDRGTDRSRSQAWDRGAQPGQQYVRSRGDLDRSPISSERFDENRGPGRERGMFGWAGDYRPDRQRTGSHQDDHYRSWRDKQVEALDRDYEDYCREREQQFHQNFDSWRQNRQAQPTASAREATGDRGDELTLTSSNEIESGSDRTGRGRSRN